VCVVVCAPPVLIQRLAPALELSIDKGLNS